MKFKCFVLMGLAYSCLLQAIADDYVSVYTTPVSYVYTSLERDGAGRVTKVIKGKLTGRSFKALYNPKDEDFICWTGKYPPGATLPKKCAATELEPQEALKYLVLLDGYKPEKFKVYLPPSSLGVPAVKFFLAQDLPFTVVMHLDAPPATNGCMKAESKLEETVNNSETKDKNKPEVSVPCLDGIVPGFIPSNREIRDRLFAGEDVVLDKGAGEAIQFQLPELQEKMGGKGHWLYFHVLRNTYPTNRNTKKIGRFTFLTEVDGIEYAKWFDKVSFDSSGDPLEVQGGEPPPAGNDGDSGSGDKPTPKSGSITARPPLEKDKCDIPTKRIDDTLEGLLSNHGGLESTFKLKLSDKNGQSSNTFHLVSRSSGRPVVVVRPDKRLDLAVDFQSTGGTSFVAVRFAPVESVGQDCPNDITWRVFRCDEGSCSLEPEPLQNLGEIKGFQLNGASWEAVLSNGLNESEDNGLSEPGLYEFYFAQNVADGVKISGPLSVVLYDDGTGMDGYWPLIEGGGYPENNKPFAESGSGNSECQIKDIDQLITGLQSKKNPLQVYYGLDVGDSGTLVIKENSDRKQRIFSGTENPLTLRPRLPEGMDSVYAVYRNQGDSNDFASWYWLSQKRGENTLMKHKWCNKNDIEPIDSAGEPPSRNWSGEIHVGVEAMGDFIFYVGGKSQSGELQASWPLVINIEPVNK